jgi:hypothetical protein
MCAPAKRFFAGSNPALASDSLVAARPGLFKLALAQPGQSARPGSEKSEVQILHAR